MNITRDNEESEPFDRAWELVRSAIQVDAEPVIPVQDFQDWERVLQLAVAHGLAPLIFTRLKGVAGNSERPASFAALRELYLRNVARNLQLSGELFRVFDLLAAGGIQVVPMRGLTLAVRAFGDFGMRGMSDLDFLIRNRDVSRALDLMDKAGYAHLYPQLRGHKKIFTVSGRDFTIRSGAYYLEFHQGMIQGPKFFTPGEEVWNNLSPVRLLKRDLPVLAPEDTVLFLAVHGLHHGWEVLKGVADLAHFAAAQDQRMDWDNLVARAESMGCLRILRIGLLLGRSVCGLVLPEQILGPLEEDRAARKWAGVYEQRLFARRSYEPVRVPFRDVPRALDTPGRRLRYVGHFVCNPTPLDLIGFSLPERFYFLHRLIRPLRLTVNAVREGISRLLRSSGGG